jgi:hypothetical protein
MKWGKYRGEQISRDLVDSTSVFDLGLSFLFAALVRIVLATLF